MIKRVYKIIFNLLITISNITSSGSFINNLAFRALNYLTKIFIPDLGLTIVDYNIVNEVKCLNITINNTSGVGYSKIYPALFFTLQNFDVFRNFAVNRIILATAIHEDRIFTLHGNFLLRDDTTLSEYNSYFLPYLSNIMSKSYPNDHINTIVVKCFNVDGLSNKVYITDSIPAKQYTKKNSFKGKREYHTTSIKFRDSLVRNNAIKPLKTTNLKTVGNGIIAMDIETVNINGEQIPVSICLSHFDNNGKPVTEFQMADIDLLRVETDLALYNLWKNVFDYIKTINLNKPTIFCHNLGSFDGFYIYKALFEYCKYDTISTIIDDGYKFIQITADLASNDDLSEPKIFTWKDSIRLFPVSLKDLCKVFNVEGKFSDYNPAWNDINTLKNDLNDFIFYSKQDTISLLNALDKAQNIYLSEYTVDICDVWSTSTLSLKIFRSKYLKCDIPLLDIVQDDYIRKGYYGGSTDYYKMYGENLYYYDVNSLYPYAMTKPIPLKIEKWHPNMKDIKLKDFFGFAKAVIICPKDIKIPLLPYKNINNLNNETIHPTGTWIATYFSEELKEVVKHGYAVKLLSGYSMSKTDLFSGYVNDFYQKKKTSDGPYRFISKMHLNQMYGYFGRSLQLINTKNVLAKDLNNYLRTRIIDSYIQISKDIYVLLIKMNLNYNLIKKLNLEIVKDTKYNSDYKAVKSNVAIAAAVTAYARIEMMKYKTLPGYNVYYSDTDSIILDKPLPTNMVGKELGQMKDELNGNVMLKAYFLGIKKYAYQLKDINSNIITKSVFAGVPRDSLSWSDIEILASGGKIVKQLRNRFNKSFKNLIISVQCNPTTSIERSVNKALINNNYIPSRVYSVKGFKYLHLIFTKLYNKVLRLLKLIKDN